MNAVTYIDLFRMMKDHIEPETVYYGGREYKLCGNSYYNHEAGYLSSMNTDRDWAEMGEVIYWDSNVLDETEKEYLKNIIRPFRDRFQYIEKLETSDHEQEYISIGIIAKGGKKGGYMSFPSFTKGRCYQKMKPYHMYQSLEELGITDWDES